MASTTQRCRKATKLSSGGRADGVVVLSDEPLPSYEHPPVVETVLSASFRQTPSVDTTQLVEFWTDALRDRYPQSQQVPPYAVQIERFGAQSGVLNIEFGTGMPTRFWFTSPDNRHLVQLQPDWIAHNWRRQPEQPDYERYPAGRKAFGELLAAFDAFLRNRADRALEPVQCEVTYVNQIDIDDGVDPSSVLRQFAAMPEESLLSNPESFQVGIAHVITDPKEGTPLGRLHVSAQSGRHREKETPVVLLNLTARGRPLTADIDGVLAFCDLGREWVVRSFAEMTSGELQEQWGPLP